MVYIWRWWDRGWLGGNIFFRVLDGYILLVVWVSHGWCGCLCGRASLKSWISEYIACVGGRLFFVEFDTCFNGLSIILRVRFQLSVSAVFEECGQIVWEVCALMCRVDLGAEGIEVCDLGFYLCQFGVVLVSRGLGWVSAFLICCPEVGLFRPHDDYQFG